MRSIRRRCDVNHTRGGIPEPHSSHTTARRDDSSAKRALRALLAVPPTTRCPLLCSTSASHDDGRSTDCAPAPAVYIYQPRPAQAYTTVQRWGRACAVVKSVLNPSYIRTTDSMNK
ncbi:hypothetical protein JYU34_011797 [Plutella xylostella]|uniref:Uncharacterized protein n=1 Tax=Plutella xylostella TaxID=51655 RepID=A0ABQ7QDK5_PLUXY|nr:hypothetical protein JYU34_011797 [Plutella xylostella]